MFAGYVFMAACATLVILSLGLLTREVFAERRRREAQQRSEQATVSAMPLPAPRVWVPSAQTTLHA